jgi:alpha-tubulin suppressor-like RCC1 family protein
MYGGLGDGTTDHSLTPVQVQNPSGAPTGFAFTSVSGGGSYSCGIGNNGRAYCWGANWRGALGNGTTTGSLTPVPVTLPADVASFTSISVAGAYNCAIGNNGRAYCWGWNLHGYLGNGTLVDSSIPVPVTLPSGVASFTSVMSTFEHSCAIGNNSRAYCWGYNGWGQLGDGTTTRRLTPVQLQNPSGAPTGFAFTSVGGAGDGYSCGVGNNGRAYCWGANERDGRLGINTTLPSALSPVTIPMPVIMPVGVTSFISNSLSGTGYGVTCGIGNNSRAYCWGEGRNGMLGNGSNVTSPIPVQVSLPAGVTSLKVQGDAVCALF